VSDTQQHLAEDPPRPIDSGRASRARQQLVVFLAQHYAVADLRRLLLSLPGGERLRLHLPEGPISPMDHAECMVSLLEDRQLLGGYLFDVLRSSRPTLEQRIEALESALRSSERVSDSFRHPRWWAERALDDGGFSARIALAHVPRAGLSAVMVGLFAVGLCAYVTFAIVLFTANDPVVQRWCALVALLGAASTATSCLLLVAESVSRSLAFRAGATGGIHFRRLTRIGPLERERWATGGPIGVRPGMHCYRVVVGSERLPIRFRDKEDADYVAERLSTLRARGLSTTERGSHRSGETPAPGSACDVEPAEQAP